MQGVKNVLDEGIAAQNFLELTRQLKEILKNSDPQVEGGLITVGEMLEDWLDCMPIEVVRNLKKSWGIDLRECVR